MTSFYRIISMTLFSIAIATATAPLGAATLPSGQAVYSEALNAMRSQTLPARIDYEVTTVDRGMQIYIQCAAKPPYTFQLSSVSMSMGNGKAIAHPPMVVRFESATGLGRATRDGKPLINCMPFPIAPVMHAFVHLEATTAPASAPASPSSPFDMMKAIVTVRAFYSRSYRIANDGIVSISGHPSYHLQFTARDGNETKHPVTDMYVDTTTHLVRAVVLGGGKRGFFMGGGGFGRFAFGHVGPYWLVKSIHVEGTGHFFFMHGGGAIDMKLHHFTFPHAAAAEPAPIPTPSPKGR
ncbi:MAG: hypothetical protein HKL91_04925 [Candidatus Eremiobacteraeota bacterium]|nr:hypothetical protein [Candidatus Eremiobacteraeota bacterium]